MLSQDRYEDIRIEKRDNGVAIATLNRPERLNAINSRMHNGLEMLPGDVNGDPDVKVLVITGAGRAFSAGGDFSAAASSRSRDGATPQYVVPMHGARLLVDNMLDCEKPVITAVNGYAMGLGATIALLGDVVFAARSAIFGDTHVGMGIGAGDGGQVLWPLLIGPARAKYYLMTGERLSADEAERLGLVKLVVDDVELMDRALALADRLASGPTQAISASKVPVNKFLKFVSNLVMPLSLAMEHHTLTTQDHVEAVAAFREKREPTFRGR